MSDSAHSTTINHSFIKRCLAPFHVKITKKLRICVANILETILLRIGGLARAHASLRKKRRLSIYDLQVANRIAGACKFDSAVYTSVPFPESKLGVGIGESIPKNVAKQMLIGTSSIQVGPYAVHALQYMAFQIVFELFEHINPPRNSSIIADQCIKGFATCIGFITFEDAEDYFLDTNPNAVKQTNKFYSQHNEHNFLRVFYPDSNHLFNEAEKQFPSTEFENIPDDLLEYVDNVMRKQPKKSTSPSKKIKKPASKSPTYDSPTYDSPITDSDQKNNQDVHPLKKPAVIKKVKKAIQQAQNESDEDEIIENVQAIVEQAGQPEADQPEADQPEADQPEADQPDAEQPDVEQNVANEDQKEEADQPEADQPDAEQPDVEQNVANEDQKEEADQPEADQPDVEQNVAKADQKEEADQPEADQPDVEQNVAKADQKEEADQPAVEQDNKETIRQLIESNTKPIISVSDLADKVSEIPQAEAQSLIEEELKNNSDYQLIDNNVWATISLIPAFGTALEQAINEEIANSTSESILLSNVAKRLAAIKPQFEATTHMLQLFFENDGQEKYFYDPDKAAIEVNPSFQQLDESQTVQAPDFSLSPAEMQKKLTLAVTYEIQDVLAKNKRPINLVEDFENDLRQVFGLLPDEALPDNAATHLRDMLRNSMDYRDLGNNVYFQIRKFDRFSKAVRKAMEGETAAEIDMAKLYKKIKEIDSELQITQEALEKFFGREVQQTIRKHIDENQQ